MKHNPRVLSFRNAGELREEMLRADVSAPASMWMSHKATFRVVRLEGVPGKAANILKQEMLSRGAECAVSHRVASFSAEPRPCILLGTERQYAKLIQGLTAQPFGLAQLGRELEQTLRRYERAPEPLVCHDREIIFGKHTLVMGIINVTSDSFSGDGLGTDAAAAARQALAFEEAGAHILDLGGESTRPGSDAVALGEEIRRVVPCVKAICRTSSLPISIDTNKPEVAKAALEAGAHIINDICALGADGMLDVAVASGAPVILMHMQGLPRDMQHDPHYDDLITEVYGFLAERTEAAIAAGIPASQIVIDPGLGFGKNAGHNLELVRRLSEFKSLGRAILMGPSRKATIGKVLDKPVDQRQWGSAAMVCASIMNGADIVRVHDVEQMAQVARMTDAILRGWDEDGSAQH